jgi:hypothetical protein
MRPDKQCKVARLGTPPRGDPSGLRFSDGYKYGVDGEDAEQPPVETETLEVGVK